MSGQPLEYTCRILPLGTFASIIIVLNVSLSVMFLGIYTDVPDFINVVLLIGTMMLSVWLLSAYATFSVSETGLSKNINTNSFLFRNAVRKQYAWIDVKGYKNGTDRGAYRGEFQYLEIRFRNGSEWKITDMYGERKDDFLLFLQYFLAKVERHNQAQRAKVPLESSNTGQPVIRQEHLFIERKKTFYETFWGKLFTVLLGVFIVLILLFAGPYMSGSSVFKLNFMLIPGFAYMFYRTFMKKYK